MANTPLLHVTRNPVGRNALVYRLAPGSTAELEDGLLRIRNAYTGEQLTLTAPFSPEYVLILAEVKGDR